MNQQGKQPQRGDRRVPEFVRFRDLTYARVNVEFQVHTTRTDGKNTVEEMIAEARVRGLGAIAFTEHVRVGTGWFNDFAAEVRSAAPVLTPQVLVGCEAKALDENGGFDAAPEILGRCDIVLGSVHRFPDGRGGFMDFEDLAPTQFAEYECRLSLGLLRAAPIDVLAHPGGMHQRRYDGFPDDLFREMMRVSLERGIAIEINSSYLADFDRFLRLCDEVNPYVSIGSDAHRREDVGRCRDRLVEAGVLGR